jgi:hypothetical protein
MENAQYTLRVLEAYEDEVAAATLERTTATVPFTAPNSVAELAQIRR